MSSRPKAVPHVHISEPHVRVTEWRFAPGAETGWHRHEADYVVVPMLDGDLLLEEPGGGSRTATLKKHVPYAAAGGRRAQCGQRQSVRFRLHGDRAPEGVRRPRSPLYSAAAFSSSAG